jgi:hypothetical protein
LFALTVFFKYIFKSKIPVKELILEQNMGYTPIYYVKASSARKSRCLRIASVLKGQLFLVFLHSHEPGCELQRKPSHFSLNSLNQ